MCVESLATVINDMGLADQWEAHKPALKTFEGRSILPYLNTTNKKKPHIFVTIGLEKEKDPQALFRQVKGITPRVTQIIGGIGVLEFIPHPHVHILVDKPEKYHKGNLIKVLARYLGIKRTTLIDIAVGSKKSDYDARLAYVSGTKVCSTKTDRVAEDAQIRDKYNIPHLIEW